MNEINALCKKYGARLIVDDAHGTGVVGKTGRRLIEACDAWEDVELMTGTFSKTFAHIGGYVVASEEMVNYLKYQSRQHFARELKETFIYANTLKNGGNEQKSEMKELEKQEQEQKRQENWNWNGNLNSNANRANVANKTKV